MNNEWDRVSIFEFIYWSVALCAQNFDTFHLFPYIFAQNENLIGVYCIGAMNSTHTMRELLIFCLVCGLFYIDFEQLNYCKSLMNLCKISLWNNSKSLKCAAKYWPRKWWKDFRFHLLDALYLCLYLCLYLYLYWKHENQWLIILLLLIPCTMLLFSFDSPSLHLTWFLCAYMA